MFTSDDGNKLPQQVFSHMWQAWRIKFIVLIMLQRVQFQIELTTTVCGQTGKNLQPLFVASIWNANYVKFVMMIVIG